MKLILPLTALATLLTFCGCETRKTDVVATIDSTVLGTEIYYRGTLLGETPLSISKTMCDTHGFSISDNQIVSDGWGEGLAFGVEDEDETKIMFLVPPAVRSNYLTIETPWGVRTKGSGSSGSLKGAPLRLTTDFMKLVDDDGIRLELDPIPTMPPSSKAELKLTISVTGTKSIKGYRPELMALWGTFDTPWRHRSSATLALDERFSELSSGDMLDVSMPIRLPNVAGDYSLFIVFHLFKGETGDDLEIGAVYSDSRLLRIRL